MMGFAIHTGAHVYGTPEHPWAPDASKAHTNPIDELATYTSPFATAGVACTFPNGIAPDHNGVQAFGLPPQFETPPASSATTLLPSETYWTPPETAVPPFSWGVL